jgi:predicted dehydrogenase
MDNVKVGVIGVGFMGEFHVRVLLEMPGVDLVGIADNNQERAKEIASKYQIGSYYTKPEDLCQQVEAVVIASPEMAHEEHAVSVLQAGCHVFLEKPLADTLEAGQAIFDQAAKSDRLFMMGYILRFDPRYIKGKEAMAQLGKITALHARRRGSIEVPQRVVGWSHPLFYMGVHDLDMLRWYTEDEVSEVYSMASFKLLDGKKPDVVVATLRFRSGAVATVEINWILPPEFKTPLESKIEVFGEGGMVLVESLDQGVRYCLRETGYEFPDALHWPELHGRIEGDLKRELEHFIRCVRTGEQPMVTAKDGLESLKIALAIMESIETGKPVSLR